MNGAVPAGTALPQMRQAQPLRLSLAGHARRIGHLHLHGLRRGSRLAGRSQKPQAGDRAITTYEIRDDPDDLPLVCATLAEAERHGTRCAARLAARFLSMKWIRSAENGLSAPSNTRLPRQWGPSLPIGLTKWGGNGYAVA